MRIAIRSRSAAITRTLDAIIHAAGHERVAHDGDYELVIEDTLHPLAPSAPTSTPILRLVSGAATADDLPCPIRPLSVIQHLQARGHVQQLPLGGGWLLDLTSRNLTHEDTTPVSLTEKESSLLKTLVQVHPAALGRDRLLADIWGVGSQIDTHTLETHIYRLRAKLASLAPTPCDILTEDGAYRLAMPSI